MKDIDFEQAKKDYPPLKYAIAVVAIVGLVSLALQYTGGNGMVAVFGALLMITAIILLFVVQRVFIEAKKTKNKTWDKITPFLLWFIVISFCLIIIISFTSAAFCFPSTLAEWIRGKPCGINKSFKITHPQNGEGIFAKEGDENGDSVEISGVLTLPKSLNGKKIYTALQSIADRIDNPPIVYFQGYANIEGDNWTVNQNSLGSSDSRIPRGDGRCVKLYRVIAIALDDKQFAQLKLPNELEKWNETAIPWETVKNLKNPDEDNYDEIVVGTYVYEKDTECRYLKQNIN